MFFFSHVRSRSFVSVPKRSAYICTYKYVIYILIQVEQLTILIRSASLGLLENKGMQIFGSCPDWCIWIRSASLDQGQTPLQLFNLCTLSSATTAMSTLCQGVDSTSTFIYVYVMAFHFNMFHFHM